MSVEFEHNVLIHTTGAEHIGLFVDFVDAKLPGLREREMARLIGRRSGDFSDTTVLNFGNSLKFPLRYGAIGLMRVTFKDKRDDPAKFHLGQSLVVLQFNKRRADTSSNTTNQ